MLYNIEIFKPSHVLIDPSKSLIFSTFCLYHYAFWSNTWCRIYCWYSRAAASRRLGRVKLTFVTPDFIHKTVDKAIQSEARIEDRLVCRDDSPNSSGSQEDFGEEQGLFLVTTTRQMICIETPNNKSIFNEVEVK